MFTFFLKRFILSPGNPSPVDRHGSGADEIDFPSRSQKPLRLTVRDFGRAPARMVLHMRNWYVLIHNSSNHQSLTELIKRLDVEVYSPCRVTLRKRTDRPSSVRRELPLFPGYLLLNFDPYVTHTTEITALNGALGFVRFGGDACVVQDSVVDALRDLILLRTDRTFNCVEYRNLPSELAKSLHLIIDMHSEVARKAAFFALLAQGDSLQRLTSRPGGRVYSAVHPL